MFRYLAPTLMLSAATLVSAQPEFEIAYAFNGGEEIVRIESEPFSVSADADIEPPTLQDLLLGFPYVTERRLGLVDIEGLFDIDLDEARPFESMARVAVTFDDLVFSSSETDPVLVDLFVDPGEGVISYAFMPPGTTFESHFVIEVAGQVSEGSIRLTWEGSGLLRREWTGIFESGMFGNPWSADGFVVPLNEPVELRFELTRTIMIPATTRTKLEFYSASRGRRGAGLHLDWWFYPDVFRLPDGVEVNSFQAGIRDNRFITCLADLDADGDLTIFDFLTFQNLFDAGDPLADFDLDGSLTIFDFLAFQNAFDAGCP